MYEITFITIDEKKENIVNDILEKNNANILLVNSMGRRKFIYPIKKENTGYYKTIYFELEQDKLANIAKTLQAEQDILRFLIIKNNEDIKQLQRKFGKKKQKVKKEKQKNKTNEKKQIKNSLIKKEQKDKTTKPIKTKKEKQPKKTSSKQLESKKIKKEKTIKKTKIEKPTPAIENEEQNRIKKLEEKLDELLKE